MEVGELDGQTLIFVGCERPGILYVYSLDKDNLPRFESLSFGRDPEASTSLTFQELYDNRQVWDIDPEDLRYSRAYQDTTRVFIPGYNTCFFFQNVAPKFTGRE